MTDGYPQAPISLETDTTVTPLVVTNPLLLDADHPTTGAFATVADLEQRWHALTSEESTKAAALLDDAADLIRVTCPRWTQATKQTLIRVSCAMVRRAMQADANGTDAGVSQTSQTAGPFSQSFTYSNPTGDLYLTTAEITALGGGGSSWFYDPITGETGR